MPVNIGELLLKEKMISPQQLQDAVEYQKLNGGKLSKALVTLGFVTDPEITSLLSVHYDVPSIALEYFEVDPAMIRIIPGATARKHQVLPLSLAEGTLTVAMGDPTNASAINAVKFITGYDVEPVVASESVLEDEIERYYDPFFAPGTRTKVPQTGGAALTTPVNLGRLLLRESMISPQQLLQALDHQELNGGQVSRAFTSLGVVKDEEITSLLSWHYGVPSINLGHFAFDPAIIKVIPAETAKRCLVLPLSRCGATLTIALADPTNVSALNDIKFMTGYNVEPVVASESAIEDAIDLYYGAIRPPDNAPAQRQGTPGEKRMIERVIAGQLRSPVDPTAVGDFEIDLSPLDRTQIEPPRRPGPSGAIVAEGGRTPTNAGGQDDRAAARVKSERTAWQYVTAMHAAALGGPRAPVRGIVEDVEDMREQLTRERDEARVRVVALEKQIERRKSWRPLWRTSSVYTAVDGLQSRLAEARRLLARAFGHPVETAARANREMLKSLARGVSGGTVDAGGIEPSGPPSADDQEFIKEHLGEGRVFLRYGFVDKARAQFETVLARFPDNSEALGELHDLRGERRDDKTAAERLVAMAKAPPETKAPAKARITLGELLMNENMVSLDQCLDALRYQKLNGGSLGAAFVGLGLLKDEEILSVLSRTYGIPSIRLEHFQPHPALIDIVPPETARKHRVLPLATTTTLTIAVVDPANRLSLDAISAMTGCKVAPVVASESALDQAIDRYYGPTHSPGDEVRGRARGGLRLAWSRQGPSRGGPGEDPAGDPPVAS